MRARNIGIDILKFLCAFLVICIHLKFPGHFGEAVKAIARIAVPIFFISTGYFLLTPDGGTDNSLNKFVIVHPKKRIIKTIKLIIFSNGMYFLLEVLVHICRNDLRGYIQQFAELPLWRDIIIFNHSPFSEPLWYLNALLYALVFIISVDKFGQRKLLYVAAPILILIDLILGTYSGFVFGHYFPNRLTRNWLIFGVSFISLGMALRDFGVLKKFNNKRKLIVADLFFLILLLIKFEILNVLKVETHRDNYVFAALLSISLFITFACIVFSEEDGLAKKIGNLGQSITTGIYIIHPMFISVFSIMTSFIPMLYLIGPIIVFILSLMTVVVFLQAKEKINHKNES